MDYKTCLNTEIIKSSKTGSPNAKKIIKYSLEKTNYKGNSAASYYKLLGFTLKALVKYDTDFLDFIENNNLFDYLEYCGENEKTNKVIEFILTRQEPFSIRDLGENYCLKYFDYFDSNRVSQIRSIICNFRFNIRFLQKKFSKDPYWKNYYKKHIKSKIRFCKKHKCQSVNYHKTIPINSYGLLSWAGSKKRLIRECLGNIDLNFDKFREVCCGSATISLSIKQLYPEKQIWINDINKDLMYLYMLVRDNPEKLDNFLKQNEPNQKSWNNFDFKLMGKNLLPEERACFFFYKHFYSFGQLGQMWGFEGKNNSRYTCKDISSKIYRTSELLQGSIITSRNCIELLDDNWGFDIIDLPYNYIKEPYYNQTISLQENQIIAEKLIDRKNWILFHGNNENIKQIYKNNKIDCLGVSKSMGGSNRTSKELLITPYL